MERNNKFFGLGKTLAAGVLALAVVPGAALATASFDAGASLKISAEFADGLEFLGSSVDLSVEDESFASGIFTISAISTPVVDPELPATDQAVRVTGSAFPAGTGSTSFPLAENSTSITFANPTDQDLSVFFSYSYTADALTSLDDALLESVGATVIVTLGTALGGDFLVDPLELFGPGQDFPPSVSGVYELEIPAGGFDGIYGDLEALGFAISTAVPVPTTLALLGIGLIGFASRKRSVAARD